MFDKSLWKSAKDNKMYSSKEKGRNRLKNEGQRLQWQADLV